MKKRILLVNEFSGLNTGYAVYGRNLFTELNKTGKYELAELAIYLDPRDPRGKAFPWVIVPGVPSADNPQLLQQYNSDQNNHFGKLMFEKVCLQVKPDIVLTLRDTWMERFVPESPFRPFFKWGWLATIDGLPQSPDWLNMYKETDALFTYSDWSKSVIEDYGLQVEATAPPIAEPCFSPVQDKEAFKREFGFGGIKIIGMGSRNQARKAFPDLLEAFREVLNRTKRSDIYLYLHTSNQDQGWNLPEIIKQTGLSSKIILTYVCKKCGYAFPSMYNDENRKCKKCGSPDANCSNVQVGVHSQGLAQIYNTWDICAQWAISEGAGMVPVEAAACGVPVIEVDYSAMSDIGRKLNGEMIEPLSFHKEVQTGRKMAVPNNEKLVEVLIDFLNLPSSIQRLKGYEARQGFEKHYSSWSKTAQVWMDWIDKVSSALPWNSPPRFHNPVQFEQIPNVSNSEFVKICMNHVLGEPSKLFGYFHLGLLKNLNYGFVPQPGSRQQFGKRECYNVAANLRARINMWEQERVKKNASI